MTGMQRGLAALVTALTATLAGPAAAAVMFHAYDSNGNDTGTCVARVTGGYVLQTCNSSTAAQLFTFNVNAGPGGTTISQSTECLVAPVGGWAVGTVVAGRACSGTDYTSKLWRWTNGTQIIGTESPSQTYCLSADGVTYSPPKLIEQLCSASTLLTKWDVVQVP